ncbi:MAG TPA: ATP-binding cassette domain-containing protein [Longimicrobium sp.]
MAAEFDLKLIDVGVTLGGKPVFRGVSLEVPPGECIVILGPSGCGKTTLLRAIAGELPYEGMIIAKQHHVHPHKPSNKVTFVTQTPSLWSHLTVLENIMLVRKLCLGETDTVARRRAQEWLALVEIEDSATKYPLSLSGGEQQRAALVRGLSAERPILLLDEVTSNIDIGRRSIIIAAIGNALSRGGIVLFVTHDVLTVRSLPYTVKELSSTGLTNVNSL